MAKRPWVTPKEVREYSEIPEVQKRSNARLAVDITRAEQYIIAYTNNTFEKCEEIPEPVKTAVLILAEAYSHNASIKAKGGIKSESFDEYSYSAEISEISAETLDLSALLDSYIIAKPAGSIILRMRKL